MSDVVGCLACDLTAGRQDLPGGVILDADGWRVEHCVGPLGVGTLLLKPLRHVTRVAALTTAEASTQGVLIHRCAAILDALLAPAQTYVCLWSHAGGRPVHIHYVVQPVCEEQIAQGVYGLKLQVAMFGAGEAPDPVLVARFADRARALLKTGPVSW
jgi:diadenosine tetraphosphate (Ap4A) HIT family hydrolase